MTKDANAKGKEGSSTVEMTADYTSRIQSSMFVPEVEYLTSTIQSIEGDSSKKGNNNIMFNLDN